jgi:Kef-type K+ transport system membrane component KefB
MTRRQTLVATTVLCALSAVAAAAERGALRAGMTRRVMLFVIQLGAILFAAKLGNTLFKRMRLPGPLGELVVGMAIGPFALGRIGLPGFPAGLFPLHPGSAVSPELYGLGALAAIVLLFTVGLETELRLLLRHAVAGGLASLGGIVLSFLLGAAAAWMFAGSLFGGPVGFLAPPCLFMGLITTATSVGITARILSERKKLDSPEGVTILSAAVIDDVLGIVLLAVVMGVVAASRATGRVDWAQVGRERALAAETPEQVHEVLAGGDRGRTKGQGDE